MAENQSPNPAQQPNDDVIILPPKFKVLFLCTGNSCRSVMAEAWTRHEFGTKVAAFSTGTAPTPGEPGSVNPDALSVLLEAGIDASNARSKHISDVLPSGPFDLVVSVCDSAAEECPLLSGNHARRIIHPSFRDPPALTLSMVDQEARLAVFRSVSNEIHDFVTNVISREIEVWKAEQGFASQEDERPEPAATKRLPFVDRFLTVWVLAAMVLGVLIGYFSKDAATTIDSWRLGTTNTPIAIGLILMMWPPLARVDYDQIIVGLSKLSFRKSNSGAPSAALVSPNFQETQLNVDQAHVQPCATACAVADLVITNPVNSRLSTRQSGIRVIVMSIIFNWIIGPFTMFLLALACLPDHDTYVQGLTYTGLARCIAMVIVWNTLSGGSNNYAAVLVAINSLLQILLYSPYAYFFTAAILPSVGVNASKDAVSFLLILRTVAIYMGIPFFLGISSWVLIPKLKGRQWYTSRFLPFISPITLIALIFTIVIIFALQGKEIVQIPLNVLRICVPVIFYFVIIFFASFYIAYHLGLSYEETVTVAFTAASNNFELSIAVTVTVFGLNSGEALACVVGALVEVPVMLAFVHVARRFKKYWNKAPAEPDLPLTESIVC